MKLRAANEIGIVCDHVKLEPSVKEEEILEQIHQLNTDPSVQGILVQLPLPESISERAITLAVAAEKDVDGFGSFNAVMVMLRECGVDLAGKHAVVIGRSDIVGMPLSQLLMRADATVTNCHSKTQGLRDILKLADVVVVAIGQPEYIKGEWIKPGAIVIDVGINYVPDSSKKSGSRMVGDVDFVSASESASHISPVPGGVGPMTVAMLLQNVVDSAVAFMKRRKGDASIPEGR
ncbi:MAG: tetrahydrofolate synthase [Lichina confinis]|nr:MAG: tetrahydrofolate synthase [Lichina confinis]